MNQRPSPLQGDALPAELHRNTSETPAGVEPALSRVAADRLAFRPRRLQEPAVGLEPTRSALQERCPACRASLAHSEYGTRTHIAGFKDPPTTLASQQPVLVSNQLDRGSEPQSPPRAWLKRCSLPEPAVGLEPTCPALRERCPACRASPALQGGRWESNPQSPVHSRVPWPLWVRPQYPWQESNLHRPPPSQGGVLPPHPRDSNQYLDQESNLDLDLRRIACSPLHLQGNDLRRMDSNHQRPGADPEPANTKRLRNRVTREGVEPSRPVGAAF